MLLKDRILLKMIDFESGCPGRAQHFLKVYQFAQIIADAECMTGEAREILDVATLMHDIGIRPCEEKYGHCTGKMQEEEGPAHARAMLEKAGCESDRLIERVCWLIAHHHTYDGFEGLDYRILIEADYLVNAYENNASREAIRNMREKIFRTDMGKYLLDTMFLAE
ncbi:MAG: HD domain-containing protein [Clostridiales bacterium]|nr:HD domain-containing protein [Clostridiales bacterium]